MDYLACGWSPDEIRRQHPHLTLAEVHAAMGYYYDHQPEIDAEITEDGPAKQSFAAVRDEAELRHEGKR